MKTLLLALGIIAAFGSLFLIDRYNMGGKEDESENESVENESIENESIDP